MMMRPHDVPDPDVLFEFDFASYLPAARIYGDGEKHICRDCENHWPDPNAICMASIRNAQPVHRDDPRPWCAACMAALDRLQNWDAPRPHFGNIAQPANAD